MYNQNYGLVTPDFRPLKPYWTRYMPSNLQTAIATRRRNAQSRQRYVNTGSYVHRPIRTYGHTSFGGLTECGKKFLSMQRDMWNRSARGACLPVQPVRDSVKFTTLTAGVVRIGVDGFGFVAAAPCAVNDSDCVWTSDTYYRGPNGSSKIQIDDPHYDDIANTPIIPPSDTQAHPGMNNHVHPHRILDCPYSSSDCSGSARQPSRVSVRIVGCALRIRYIGREDAQSGQIVGYVEPNHESLNLSTYSEAIVKSESVFKPTSKGWTSISSIGVTPADQKYPEMSLSDRHTTQLYPWSNNQVLASTSNPYHAKGPPCLAFYLQGIHGHEFAFEYIQHCEAVGKGTTAMATKNQADPAAVTKAQNDQAQNGSGSGKRPGYNLYGYNYVGPGNPLDGLSPTSTLDNVALQHDIAYRDAKSYKDVAAADVKFMKESWPLDHGVGALSAAAIGLKYSAEQLYGPIYPSNFGSV